MQLTPRRRKRMEKMAFAVLLIAIVSVLVYHRIESLQIRSESAYSTGKIYEAFTARSLNGYSIRYKYVLNDVEYTNSTGIFFDKTKGKYIKCLLVGKTFPITYQISNPGNSKMLFFQADYENHSLQIPDTLKKYVQYIDSLVNGSFPFDSSNNPCMRF